jgi:hypothetical protein
MDLFVRDAARAGRTDGRYLEVGYPKMKSRRCQIGSVYLRKSVSWLGIWLFIPVAGDYFLVLLRNFFSFFFFFLVG